MPLNTTTIIILSLLLIALIGGGIGLYFYLLNQKNNSTPNPPISPPTSSNLMPLDGPIDPSKPVFLRSQKTKLFVGKDSNNNAIMTQRLGLAIPFLMTKVGNNNNDYNLQPNLSIPDFVPKGTLPGPPVENPVEIRAIDANGTFYLRSNYTAFPGQRPHGFYVDCSESDGKPLQLLDTDDKSSYVTLLQL